MSKRATLSQAEIERLIRAAQKTGAIQVEIKVNDQSWAKFCLTKPTGHCPANGYRWLERPDGANSIHIPAFLDRRGEVSS
jgi:hypothetical protein